MEATWRMVGWRLTSLRHDTSIIPTAGGGPTVAETYQEFMGHKVDRRMTNVFVEHYSIEGVVTIPAEHHILESGTRDGWHFWVAPEGVMLVTIREGGATYHYGLTNVRRCIVLPRVGGDIMDPLSQAEPVCEWDSEVIRNLDSAVQEMIVDDAEQSAIRPVYFHNQECADRWKEEQGGETPGS